MIKNSIVAEIKYCFYEYRDSRKILFVLLCVFIGGFIYCLNNQVEISTLTNLDSMLIIELATYYLFARLIISSLALPINVFSNELENCGASNKNSLYRGHLSESIIIRILSKSIINFCLTYLTFFLIFWALNLVVSIKNYIIIGLLFLVENLILLAVGIIISQGMLVFNIKKEFVLLFEGGYFFYIVWCNTHTYFLPSMIISNLIQESFSADLVYGQFELIELPKDIPYLCFVSAICIGLIVSAVYVSKYNILINTYKSKKRPKEMEKSNEGTT